MFVKSSLIALLGAASVSGKVYMKETFDESWAERWITSKFKGAESGEFELHKQTVNVDKDNVGLKTTKDAKFYAASHRFEPFSNEGKDLVVQYQLKHEQPLKCGGGYIKLYNSEVVQEDLNGDSPYNIMFGPDVCGNTKRIHVIFSYKGENYVKKTDIKYETDNLTHVYTLVVKSDNTFQVLMDMSVVSEGNLEDDWDFLQPKEIDDPEDKKPKDWVEEQVIADPEDTKPEDWDQPAEIVDPEAEKPDDWDEEDDGEWEAPMIKNPEFKGEWTPKMIENPDYNGVWEAKKIPNPDFEQDKNLYRYSDNSVVGIDIWQVEAGSVFDSFIITDDLDEAKKFYEDSQAIEIQTAEKVELEELVKKASREAEAEQMFSSNSGINIDDNDFGMPDEDEDEDGDDNHEEL